MPPYSKQTPPPLQPCSRLPQSLIKTHVVHVHSTKAAADVYHLSGIPSNPDRSDGLFFRNHLVVSYS